MTVQSRSTLKSYFISGASPSESDFSDLIDSTLLVEDIVTSLDSTSTTDPLAASLGKLLNDSITLVSARVDTLEDAENNFADGYYNKTEIDGKFDAVDDVIVALPYTEQITDIQSQISDINVSLSGKADTAHTQAISSIVDLQSTLDTKATIDQLNSVRDSLIESINAIDTGSGGSVDLSGINASIASLTEEISDLESELNGKADINHVHNVYSKGEVDALISGIDVTDHEHVSADITDFNAEVQAKTNLLVSDHSNLTNNPHAVTKEQVGLGKVENLTPSEIIDLAGGVSQLTIDGLETTIEDHIANNGNPHGVTKDQIGLGNVTNDSAIALMNAHLAESNPHNIDLTFFDVYATAEADARTQFYIDSLRYAFTPLANNDSAGAIGDFAYDSSNLYFKLTDTEWGKIPFNPVYIEREATQEDVDAGRASAVGDFINVNEVAVQEVSNISVTETFNITNVEGDNVFNITEEGDIQLTNTTIAGDTIIEGDTVINETISSSTNHVTIENNTSVEGIISAPTGSLEYIDTREIEFWEAHKFAPSGSGSTIGSVPKSSKLTLTFGHDDNDTQIPDRLKLNTEYNGIKEVAYLDDLPDLSGYALKSELPSTSNDPEQQEETGGTETDIVIPGTTGGELSGYAYSPSGKYAIDAGGDGVVGTGDDIDEEYWSLTTSTSLNTGLLIDFGNSATNPYIRYSVTLDRWEAFDGTNVRGFEQASELIYDATSGSDPYIRFDPLANAWVAFDGQSVTEVGSSTTVNNNTTVNETNVLNQTIIQESLTIDAQTGGAAVGYAFTEDAGKYSIDYGADGTYGTGDDDDSEDYFEVSASAYQNSGLTVDVGRSTNPSIKYDVNHSRWKVDNGSLPDGYSYLPTPGYNYTAVPPDIGYTWIYHTNGSRIQFPRDPNFYLANGDKLPNQLEVDTTSSGGGPAPFIKYDGLAGEWVAFNGTSLEVIGESTTIVNEGDTVTNTTVLNQTIVQQNLTVDGTSGGEENGYAYAEYDDGSGTFVAVKYSIDYGADNTFGTSDDDDSEDYFEVDESAYNNAGLTINAGLSTTQPSVVYDGTTNKWLVDNGEDGSTDYGSFHLKDVDAAVSALVDSAPGTLNTLNELAAALGDDANFATTTSTALGNRVRVDTASQGLSSTQKSNARTNIGAQVAGSYAAASHNHDGRYYTETEVNNLLSNLQSTIEAKFYSI